MASQHIIQEGRITSLFGTYFPPKRKQVAKKHLTISFVLLGTIPSKKNLLWAGSNLHFIKPKLYAQPTVAKCVDFLSGENGLKVFLQNSKKYTEWLDEKKPLIQEQAKFWEKKFKDYGLELPLTNASVKVYHYWKDDIMERDLTNKLDTIADLMVVAGIIKNDNWQILRRIHSDGESYKDQIVEAITRIDITQSYFD
jgi:hypothetical protein